MFDEYRNGYNQVYHIYTPCVNKTSFTSQSSMTGKGMEVCPVCHIYTPGVKLNLFAANLPMHGWQFSKFILYIPPVKLNLFGYGIIPVDKCFGPVNICLVFLDDYTPSHQVFVKFNADVPTPFEADFRIPLPQ